MTYRCGDDTQLPYVVIYGSALKLYHLQRLYIDVRFWKDATLWANRSVLFIHLVGNNTAR